MKIFIMRHGQAAMMAPSDETRPLTSYGESQAIQQGKKLKDKISHIEKVLVSPYLRTNQTFDGVNFAFEGQLTKEICNDLTPHGESRLVVDYLEMLKDQGVQSVLVISHIPMVHDLIYDLSHQSKPLSYSPSSFAELTWLNQWASLDDFIQGE